MKQNNIISQLKKDPILNSVFIAAGSVNTEAYLVGGVLRNLFLSKPIGFDYDIALQGRVREVANLLGDILKGSPFLLDKQSGSYRVIVKGDSGAFNIDISPFNGKDISEDLGNRDFTINAMALDINSLFKDKGAAILDPFNGRGDAEDKIIRMLKPEIFDEDPLRLLRGVRLSAQHDLVIDKDTEWVIKTKAAILGGASWERIRDEFFLILSCRESVHHVKRLYDLSLLHAVIPEILDWENLNGYDLISHSLKTLEQGEMLYNNLRAFVPQFAENLSVYFKAPFGSVDRKGLFKLSLFIHDAGKPATIKEEQGRIRFIGHDTEGEPLSRRIGRRLKLSRNSVSFVSKLVRNHHRVFNLASLERVMDRSKAHLFRVMGGGDGLSLVLLALADARATRNGEDPELASFVKNLISFYFNVYAVKKPRPILNGDQVMEIFGIQQGVIVGKILNKLSEAEGEGLVKNKKDAIKFIKNWLTEF